MAILHLTDHYTGQILVSWVIPAHELPEEELIPTISRLENVVEYDARRSGVNKAPCVHLITGGCNVCDR